MNTVTLSIASREDVTRRALAAFGGERQGAHISFESVELLWQTLTRKRWELLKAMTGQDAMTIREATQRVDRDVKAVHGDVQTLLNAGILDRTADGRIVFPYDAVHRLKLMYHRLVVRRLARDSSLIDDARKVVSQWQAQPERKTFIDEWKALLSQPPDRICRFISSRSQDATRLRLSSPFPHVERLQVGDEATRRRMWRKAWMSVR
jgi:predicted transcriptional regulator